MIPLENNISDHMKHLHLCLSVCLKHQSFQFEVRNRWENVNEKKIIVGVHQNPK